MQNEKLTAAIMIAEVEVEHLHRRLSGSVARLTQLGATIANCQGVIKDAVRHAEDISRCAATVAELDAKLESAKRTLAVLKMVQEG